MTHASCRARGCVTALVSAATSSTRRWHIRLHHVRCGDEPFHVLTSATGTADCLASSAEQDLGYPAALSALEIIDWHFSDSPFLLGRGNLPHRLTLQVGLLGAQAPLPDPVVKAEMTRCGFLAPHLGHLISLSLSAMRRRSSNLSPHPGQLYSYIGM